MSQSQTRKSPAVTGLSHIKAGSRFTTRDDLDKQARIPLTLFEGRMLHRFKPEVIGDHTLNSTISTLANRHGLLFERAWIKVPNQFGSRTPVIEYALAVSSHDSARRLLIAWGAHWLAEAG